MEHRYNRGAPKPIPEAPRARRSSSSVATAGKSIVTVLQYLVSAASLLVPSSYPYYEVVCEGIHSLSQLLPYLTRLALSSSDEVIQRSSRLEAVLRAVTRSVGFVEVRRAARLTRPCSLPNPPSLPRCSQSASPARPATTLSTPRPYSSSSCSKVRAASPYSSTAAAPACWSCGATASAWMATPTWRTTASGTA